MRLDEHDISFPERKRSRPTSSSLDIKIPNGIKATTPFPGKKLVPPQQQYEQQQLQQPMRQQSRAQAALMNGRPPRHVEFLNNMPNLSEEQIRMALEHDPELATAAAEAWASNQKYNRQEQHPQHLRAMMEEGIPVKQWIILLVLLGAGLWQLKKVLQPEKKNKNAPPRKSPQKSPKKMGNSKKGKKAMSKSNEKAPKLVIEEKIAKQETKKTAPAKSEVVPALATEKKIANAPPPKEVAVSNKDKKAAAPAAEEKKTKPAKKKKRASKKPKKVNEEENLTADDEKQGQSTEKTFTNGGDLVGKGQSDLGGEGEWQTVGGRSAAAPDKGNKNGSKAPDDVADKGKDVPMTPAMAEDAENDKPRPSKEASAVQTTAASPQEPKKAAPEPTAKKAESATTAAASAPEKNGKANNTTATKEEPAKVEPANVGPNAPDVTFTDDDAALALKLQEEEEKLAKELSQPVDQDVWAEVTTKKNRRKSTEPVAGPAATAAW